MKRRRILASAAVLVLAAALLFALLPVSSRRYRVQFDAAKIQRKQEFLRRTAATRELPVEGERPNILLILADDLGMSDLSLYGGSPSTPHIDAIGEQGVVFTDAYCTSAVCSPSRAAILTGRYQQRFGYELQTNSRYPRNRLEYWIFKHLIDIGFWRVAELAVPSRADIGRQGLDPGEITLAELLQAGGYATGLFGKWHLGHEEPFLPTRRGFDYHYGFYEAFTLYDQVDDPGVVNRPLREFSDRHQWRQGRTGTSAIRRNDTVVDERRHLTDSIADEAIQFLRAQAGEPFFCCVAFSAPHVPYQAQRQYYDQVRESDDETRRVYQAMVRNLDDAVGRITQEVNALGLSPNTLVFFASDNGSAWHTGAADNAQLKGGKFMQFEGGLNIPFMLRWEGVLSPGQRAAQRVHTPVSLMDVFATAAAAAGVPLPPDREYDGRDLLPHLLGGEQAFFERPLFWRALYNKAVRRGEWKLLVNERSGQVQLYDLVRDRGERRNLAPARQDVVEQLLEELRRWEKTLQPPSWPRVMDAEFIIDGVRYRFAI